MFENKIMLYLTIHPNGVTKHLPIFINSTIFTGLPFPKCSDTKPEKKEP